MDQSIKFEPIGRGKFVAVSKNHTFGTDAVLLAAFSKARKKDVLVDLGTGCGIIPFLLLREGLLSRAVGVDIMSEATELAALSAEKNGFDNFSAVNADINDLKGKAELSGATLVICNPPYKAIGAGITNTDTSKLTARHETTCTLSGIVKAAANLLQTGGRFCVCQRPERAAELMYLMKKDGLEPKRLRLVAKKTGEKPWLVLIEGRRGGNTGLDIEPTLYLYGKDGELSDEMLEIYGEYKKGFL